jgi:hypothetical protein
MKRPAPRGLNASVSKIRKYADSFLGLSMKEVRTRLGKAKVKRGKWESGGVGGPELVAKFPDHTFIVMFYEGKAITTSFRVLTS